MKNNTKTTRQWFEELPSDIEAMAIKNAEAHNAAALDLHLPSIEMALRGSFLWSNTTQGHFFWDQVAHGHFGQIQYSEGATK